MGYTHRMIDPKWRKFDYVEDYPSKKEWEWQIHQLMMRFVMEDTFHREGLSRYG